MTVAQTTNSAVTMLYGHVGLRIRGEVLKETRASYGERIVATLAEHLNWSHFAETLPLKAPCHQERSLMAKTIHVKSPSPIRTFPRAISCRPTHVGFEQTP